VAGFKAPFDSLVDLGVALGPEDRAGPGVRVHQPDLFGREAEMAVRFLELLDAAAEKGEVCLRMWSVMTGKREKTEDDSMVDSGEEELFVFEMVEACE